MGVHEWVSMRPKTVSDTSTGFVGPTLPIFVRHADPARRISARTRGRAYRMTSETGGRRRRAGHPPPGNRSNFTGAKPAVRVESFSFDVDDAFIPTIDALGETDDARLNEDESISWGPNFHKELSEDDKGTKNSNGVSGSTFIEDDGTIRSYEDDDDEEGEEEDDEEEEIVDELEQLDFEEQEEDDPLLSAKDDDDLDEYEDDLTVTGISSSSSRSVPSSRGRAATGDLSLTGMDLDAEDDVPDDDELVEMDTEKLHIDTVLASMTHGTSAETDLSVTPDLIPDEELEDPSEAELQSAAELLTGSGLLGLGASVELEENEAPSKASGKAHTKTGAATKTRELSFRDLEDDDDEDGEIPLPLDAEDELSQVQGLDSYSDLDDDEEAEFTLTSKTEGSFGRVWELNEDTYVTITEPGQTYAYELDEEDSDDQEMSSLRRGAQGGWGSGLQNDAKNKYAPGSREWIARRSYDLLSKATAREMKLWTKRQSSPPPDIDSLYPDYSKPQAILGKVALTQSLPKISASIRAVGFDPDEDPNAERAEFGNDVLLGSENSAEKSGVSGNAQARSALERAVKFPCSFKFKVEGFGEGLIDSLIADVQRVLKKTLPRSNFHEEPAGRYTRIVFAVEVEVASHVTDLYDAFRQNSLVKFSYG